MTLRRSIAVAAVVLAAAPRPGRAQAPAGKPLKIAVIDTEKVLLQSRAGKAALEGLKSRQKVKEEELKSRQAAVKELQDRVSAGSLTLSDEKLGGLKRELEEKAFRLKQAQEEANRELGRERDRLLAEIDAQVMPVITQYGKENGYTFLFRKFESGLLFADEAADVTSEVIVRLDARTPPASSAAAAPSGR